MRAVPRHRRAVLVLVGVLVLLGIAGVGLAATLKPDYGLQVSPASQSVSQGQTATFMVTTTGTNGFSGAVALTVSGLPAGAAATVTPTTVSLAAGRAQAVTTVAVTTARTTPVGTHALTITGTSGKTKRSVSASLTLSRVLDGAFTVTADPAWVPVGPGSTAVYSLTVAATGTHSGPVRLAAHGTWPAGVTPALSPAEVTVASPATATVPSSAVATLQVATGRSVRDGTYPLQVVGTATDAAGRTTRQYAILQLVVDSKLSSKPFTIATGAPLTGLAPGAAPRPMDLVLANPNNQPLSVTNLSVVVTGTSAGAACGADNFRVVQYRGPYPLAVPANARGATLGSLGVPAAQQPQLAMVDKPTVNQDACKGVTVTLAFSGSAQGR